MIGLDVMEVRFAYLCNIYSTHAYANSIEIQGACVKPFMLLCDIVCVLSARGNSCYMLHEIEWHYSEQALLHSA